MYLWIFHSGQEKIAEILIENGAVVDGKNDFGKAPIHLASQRGNLHTHKNAVCGLKAHTRND